MRAGAEVTWLDPYPTRLPVLDDLTNKRPAIEVDSSSPAWLTVLKPKAIPIEPLPCSGMINRILWQDIFDRLKDFINAETVLGIGKPSELALQALSQYPSLVSFYDAMDDFPAFYKGLSNISMVHKERRTVQKVNTVLASSTALYQRLKNGAKDVRLVFNACASERLPEIKEIKRSSDKSNLVCGYIGTIGQWFDWPLVFSLAKTNPDVSFRIIGPMYEKPPHKVLNNMSVEPPIPHAEALQTMMQFDVGLIPFKKTPLTSSVDPIKYYEYRALGLPVISSSFGQMAFRGLEEGVLLLDDASNMENLVRQALQYRAMTLLEMQIFREENSWMARFEASKLLKY